MSNFLPAMYLNGQKNQQEAKNKKSLQKNCCEKNKYNVNRKNKVIM